MKIMIMSTNIKATHEIVAVKDIEHVNRVCDMSLRSDNPEEYNAGRACAAMLRRLGIRRGEMD